MAIARHLPYHFNEDVLVCVFDRPIINYRLVCGCEDGFCDAKAVCISHIRAIVVNLIELVTEVVVFHARVIDLLEHECGLLYGVYLYCYHIAIGKKACIAFRTCDGVCESALILGGVY